MTAMELEAKQGDYLVGADENVLVLNRAYANRAAKMQWELYSVVWRLSPFN
ncbi:late control-like protein [Enterobacter hormaechei]|nr:late control-like protein [Enterobacter hormaechei]VAG31307.1 late control-like protein [Enterobacter hormaechei]VAM34348.1 late control-like protein [Enterobacter hormaechei]